MCKLLEAIYTVQLSRALNKIAYLLSYLVTNRVANVPALILKLRAPRLLLVVRGNHIVSTGVSVTCPLHFLAVL